MPTCRNSVQAGRLASKSGWCKHLFGTFSSPRFKLGTFSVYMTWSERCLVARENLREVLNSELHFMDIDRILLYNVGLCFDRYITYCTLASGVRYTATNPEMISSEVQDGILLNHDLPNLFWVRKLEYEFPQLFEPSQQSPNSLSKPHNLLMVAKLVN